MTLAKSKLNDETTWHLLDIAALHFAEKGLSGARVDEIALEAGVSKSSLYYRFADKQALYDAVIGEMIGRILNATLSRTAEVANAQEKFNGYVHAIADVILGEAHVAPILLREVATGGVNMSKATHEALCQLKSHLQEILDLGKQQKIFRAADAELLHLIIGGTLNFIGAGISAREHLAVLQSKQECKIFFQEQDAIINQFCQLLSRSLVIDHQCGSSKE